MTKLSLEQRLKTLKKSLAQQAPSMVPDFASERRTAELDPETKQLLRRLDQWGHDGQTSKAKDQS